MSAVEESSVSPRALSQDSELAVTPSTSPAASFSPKIETDKLPVNSGKAPESYDLLNGR